MIPILSPLPGSKRAQDDESNHSLENQTPKIFSLYLTLLTVRAIWTPAVILIYSL